MRRLRERIHFQISSLDCGAHRRAAKNTGQSFAWATNSKLTCERGANCISWTGLCSSVGSAGDSATSVLVMKTLLSDQVGR